jgi:hypothetical protein
MAVRLKIVIFSNQAGKVPSLVPLVRLIGSDRET